MLRGTETNRRINFILGLARFNRGLPIIDQEQSPFFTAEFDVSEAKMKTSTRKKELFEVYATYEFLKILIRVQLELIVCFL